MEVYVRKGGVQGGGGGGIIQGSGERVLEVRSKYRVVGHLVGGLPQYPSQTEFCGPPLLLSPEEVTLLIQLGVAKLIDASVPPKEVSQEDKQAFIENRKLDATQQLQQMVEFRKRKADVFSAKNKKKQKQKDATNSTNSEGISDRDDKYLAELKGNEQITIESVSNQPRVYEDPTTFWTFPVTREERHRFIVFEDMWKRGFYLTSGSKFGGDFLAYSGDPLQFHAHYVVIIKPPEEELSPLDIISYGRLGVTVKKTPVLASVFEETGKVSYFSIDWQGVT